MCTNPLRAAPQAPPAAPCVPGHPLGAHGVTCSYHPLHQERKSVPSRLGQALVSRPEERLKEMSTVWLSLYSRCQWLKGLWWHDLRTVFTEKLDAKVSSAPQHRHQHQGLLMSWTRAPAAGVAHWGVGMLFQPSASLRGFRYLRGVLAKACKVLAWPRGPRFLSRQWKGRRILHSSPALPQCTHRGMPQPPDPALTAAPWKSLPRLFWKMIQAFHNCFWKDTAESLQDSWEKSSQGHTLPRAAMPAAPLLYHRLCFSRNDIWALVSTSLYAQQNPGRCTAEDCNRVLLTHLYFPTLISAVQSEAVLQTKLSNIPENFKKWLLSSLLREDSMVKATVKSYFSCKS